MVGFCLEVKARKVSWQSHRRGFFWGLLSVPFWRVSVTALSSAGQGKATDSGGVLQLRVCPGPPKGAWQSPPNLSHD